MKSLKCLNYRVTTLLLFSLSAAQLQADEFADVHQEREMGTSSRRVNDNTDLISSYTNVAQMLEGRISSLDINGVSSTPGADPLLVIRGRKSFVDERNTVAIYLNDVPFDGSLSAISPEDIETITVYKGTDASAIFGEDGRNGVISIKTKSGKMHRELDIRYKGYVGARKIFSPYPMMNAKELRDFRITKYGAENAVRYFEDSNLDTDWQKEFFQTGITTSHNIAIKGGGDKTTFYVSAGYLKDQGIIPTQYFTRYSNSIQLTHRFGENAGLGFQSVNNHTKTHNGDIANDIYLPGIILASPMLMFDEEYSSLFKYLDKDYIEEKVSNNDNAYASRNMLFAYFNIPQIPELTLKVVGGMNFLKDRIKLHIKDSYTDSRTTDMSRNFYLNPQINYNATFNDVHQLSASLHYIARKSMMQENREVTEIIYSDGSHIPEKSTFELSDTLKRRSVLANLGYCYDRRYSILGVVRKEAMEDEVSHATSFSTTARWHVKEESWMTDVLNIDEFDVRGSVGQVESPIHHFSIFGNEYGGTERYLSYTLGVDFSLFLGRIRGSLSMYKEKNSNLLNGFLKNKIETSNRGVELYLHADIIRRHGWRWNASFNLASNRNRIESDKTNYSNLAGSSINVVSDFKGHKRYLTGAPDGTEMEFDYYDVDPKVYGGFSTDITYRRLKLDVHSTFHIGGKLYSTIYDKPYINLNYLKQDYNVIKDSDDRKYVMCSTGVFDGGYLKIRDVTLSYDVPHAPLRRYGMKELRVYATVQNPFVLMSDYYRQTKMYPETNGKTSSYPDHIPPTNVKVIVPSFPCIVPDAPATRNFIVGIDLHF